MRWPCFTDPRQFYVILWLCHQELQRKRSRVCLPQAVGKSKASIFRYGSPLRPLQQESLSLRNGRANQVLQLSEVLYRSR